MIEEISKYQPSERSKAMLREYYSGYTLQSIGKRYAVTRERVRQIVNRTAIYELANVSTLDPSNEIDRKVLADQVTERFKSIRKERKNEKDREILKKIDEKIIQAKNNGIYPDDFFSVRLFTRATGINERQLREYRSDIIENILNNKRKKWSWHYSQCRMCGTTIIKHRSLGYCIKCYPKSPEWKESIKASYLKNKSHRAESVNRYHKEYIKRPEVQARTRVKNDLNNFGGNREIALSKQNNRCQRCEISRDKHREKYKRDLYVIHKDGNRKNNDLNNLEVICQKCFGRFIFRSKHRT